MTPTSQLTYPLARTRRLRLTPTLRRMLRETPLSTDDFICPVFIRHGKNVQQEIASMPGIYQRSADKAAKECQELFSLGIPAVLLFGIPAEKDPIGLENFSDDGIIQQAARVIKNTHPEMVVITDVCMCEYTEHGHCGILNVGGQSRPNLHLPEGYVLNDETLEILAKVAVSHAAAGADIAAPSGMIDGMVTAIRAGL